MAHGCVPSLTGDFDLFGKEMGVLRVSVGPVVSCGVWGFELAEELSKLLY